MKCPKCGAEIEIPFAIECPKCGVLFSKAGATHPPHRATTPKSSAPPWVWIVIAIVLLSVLTALPRRRHVDDSWYRGAVGYDRALAEHNSTHKPLLVYFYTDW